LIAGNGLAGGGSSMVSVGEVMSDFEKNLMGIGQPGRLHQLEMRVESHERSVQRLKGLTGAFGGLLTLVHLVIAYMGGRHN
jgi:hypothetical protein